MSKKVYIVFSGSKQKIWSNDFRKKRYSFVYRVFNSLDKSIALKYRDRLRCEGKRSFIKTRCFSKLLFT